MDDDLVVILTALNLEYQAVRDRLHSLHPHRHETGTRFEIGTLPGGHGRAALGLAGKGNHSSAVLAERAIQEFAPHALLFVGVAGALWETPPLGDVVVATHVYAYHGGTSEDDGLKARPRVWEADHAVSQAAAHVARLGSWPTTPPSDRPRPTAHLGAIAAGEVVQNSRISHEAAWVRQIYNDAAAIEMEGAGVAQAGHLSGSPVAIVRGISDRADGTKNGESDVSWQPAAAASAADFALELARELIDASENGDHERHAMPTHPRRPGRPAEQSGNVHNSVHGGTVGFQAGHISGNVNVSQTANTPRPPHPAEALAEIRHDLDRERASGGIDPETHGAASSEIDTADKAIEEGTPRSRSTALLALKRLSGLLADLTSIAAKVAALIIRVKGES